MRVKARSAFFAIFLTIAAGCLTGHSDSKSPPSSDYMQSGGVLDFASKGDAVSRGDDTSTDGKSDQRLPVFDLQVFPEPRQGPLLISSDCWKVGSGTRLSWRVVSGRICTALSALGFDRRIYALSPYGNRGFVIVSSIKEFKKEEKTARETGDWCRQFVFVLTPDIVEVNGQEAEEHQFRYFTDHGGLVDIPDALADGCFVNTSAAGDHLYLLVYRFHRGPFDKLFNVDSEDHETNHYEESGLGKELRSQRDKQG
jgi:hypothetical protein